VLAGSLPHGTLNKPLQPYCINTASPIGTEILIEFVVFEQNSYPPKMSTVTRTVNIVAPCDVGFELCPQDNVCSDIDCDQRELLSSQVTVMDTMPPTLRTTVPAVVEVPYGETTDFKYTVCATCGDAGCGMCAEDADDGDVSGSLRVIQIKAAEDDLSCPISAVSEGQCGTGTYIYEYTAADTAGNEAMAKLELRIVSTGEVVTSYPMGAFSGADGEENAAAAGVLYATTGSPENLLFINSLAASLGGGGTYTPDDLSVLGSSTKKIPSRVPSYAAVGRCRLTPV
jgi:hypothetical protein